MLAPLGTRPGSEQFSYHAHPDMDGVVAGSYAGHCARIMGHYASGTCPCTPLNGSRFFHVWVGITKVPVGRSTWRRS
jgi:hypothetical protein